MKLPQGEGYCGIFKYSVIEAKGVKKSSDRKNRVRRKEGLEQNPRKTKIQM
jgi:hypothetical protein